MTSIAEKIFDSERPNIIGHRGYSAVAPENTLPSFGLALEAGARFVELDYRHSKDGVPIVIHDHILDRTTNARKKWKRRRIKIARTSAAEIQTLDAGSWFDAKFAGTKVPLLADALEFICGNGGVAVIEHKSGDVKTLAKLLGKLKLINRVVVISFDWKFLREFHELEPRQILGALGPPARLSNGRRPAHIRRRLGARLNDIAKSGSKIVVWNRRLSRRDIQLARGRGLMVWVYTVDQIIRARELLKQGVNGIITNDLSIAKSVGIQL